MEKKLLTAAIAGALATGMSVANADVTVFGHLDESILAWDIDGSGDDINLVCTTCSVGFKGSEDLGNGLKAIFKLDFQFDINNRNVGKPTSVAINDANADGIVNTNEVTISSGSSGAITDRDQWVGLAGEGWGSIKFGTISSGYKSTGAMIDPIYRTVAQARGVGLQSRLHLGAGEEGQGRMTNHVRYDSPSMSGFKVIVDYVFDSSEGDGENDNPWNLTGLYKNGPVLVFGSYITTNRGGNDDAWKIGGSFQINDEAKVFAQYENDGGLLNSYGTSTADGGDVWHIGGTYTMGSNTIYAAYGQGDDNSGTGADTAEYQTFSIVGIHGFSKRTLAYLGYINVDCDGTAGPVCGSRTKAGEADYVALGIKHKF